MVYYNILIKISTNLAYTKSHQCLVINNHIKNDVTLLMSLVSYHLPKAKFFIYVNINVDDIRLIKSFYVHCDISVTFYYFEWVPTSSQRWDLYNNVFRKFLYISSMVSALSEKMTIKMNTLCIEWKYYYYATNN